MKELLDFIDSENERIAKFYGSPTQKERVLVRTVKIMEEVGELANEVLHSLNEQRKDKITDKEKLDEEVADVLITTLLLAKALDINVEKALENKIKKISARYE